MAFYGGGGGPSNHSIARLQNEMNMGHLSGHRYEWHLTTSPTSKQLT